MEPLMMPTALAGRIMNPVTPASSPDPSQVRDKEELMQAAKKFEALFVHKLLGSMRETIPKDGLFGDGISRQMQDMYWMFMGDEMARRGSLGLWKQLAEQFTCDTGNTGGAAEVEVMK